MITLKEIAIGLGELIVFSAFIVIAYLFLAALCVLVHSPAQCHL